jgi:hypothetical protein
MRLVSLLQPRDPVAHNAKRINLRDVAHNPRINLVAHLVETEQTALDLELLVPLLSRNGRCKRVVIVDTDDAEFSRAFDGLADVVVGLTVLGHRQDGKNDSLCTSNTRIVSKTCLVNNITINRENRKKTKA